MFCINFIVFITYENLKNYNIYEIQYKIYKNEI